MTELQRWTPYSKGVAEIDAQGEYVSYDDHRAALSALTQGGVKVKELVWRNNNGREWAGDWPMRYEIYNCPWGYVVEMNSMKVPHGTEAHKTLAAAKAAAQADYDVRILSALSTTLQEPVGGQVIGRVHHNPDHAEPVRAVLNSVGRALPDDTKLYASPTLSHQPVTAAEPVAEVVWYDPKSDMIMYERPHKIIDASIEFIENAPLGTKLYAHQVTAGWAMVPEKMTADMINAWSGGITVSSDEVAYRTTFQDAWSRVLQAALKSEGGNDDRT